MAKDQASIDVAKLNLEYCYVRSPTDGRTGRRLVDPGNYVAAGGAILVNIQLQDPVYVDFTISENDLAQLRENMGRGNSLRVDVLMPSKPDIVKTGKLSFLDNSVSTQSGTALLRATIPNPDRYLWPGQYVNVTLTLQVLKDALVVPGQAVQMGGKGYLLVRGETGRYRRTASGDSGGEIPGPGCCFSGSQTGRNRGRRRPTCTWKRHEGESERISVSHSGPPPARGVLTERDSQKDSTSGDKQESSAAKSMPAL